MTDTATLVRDAVNRAFVDLAAYLAKDPGLNVYQQSRWVASRAASLALASKQKEFTAEVEKVVRMRERKA